jgi:hypothetical protein
MDDEAIPNCRPTLADALLRFSCDRARASLRQDATQGRTFQTFGWIVWHATVRDRFIVHSTRSHEKRKSASARVGGDGAGGIPPFRPGAMVECVSTSLSPPWGYTGPSGSSSRLHGTRHADLHARPRNGRVVVVAAAAVSAVPAAVMADARAILVGTWDSAHTMTG